MSEKHNGTALLVMEMQNDFFRENRREKFTYDTAALTAAVNETVKRAESEGQLILFIRQIFPDTPTNHLAMGFCIAGTDGTELYSGLYIPSGAIVFEKNTGDLFTDEAFTALLKEHAVTQIRICGIDLCGGIAGTAKGAVQAGLPVCVLQGACGTRFDTRMKGKTVMQLKAAGVQYV